MSFWASVYINPDDDDRNGDNTIASWETRLIHWDSVLDELVKAGKLTQCRSDYFPSVYRGLARDVLPILPADRKTKYSAYYTSEMLQERIDRCSPDTELGIMIWDMG